MAKPVSSDSFTLYPAKGKALVGAYEWEKNLSHSREPPQAPTIPSPPEEEDDGGVWIEMFAPGRPFSPDKLNKP